MLRISRGSKFISRYFLQNQFSIENKFQLDPSVPQELKSSDHMMKRFIGPRDHEVQEMLKVCGARDLDHLVDLIVPQQIQDKNALSYGDFPVGMSEQSTMEHMKQISEKNKLFANFLGQGYYGTLVPAVIQRNIFENPAWYTAYTPYQGEISQGRLESLLNYQTMVCELTGMDVSNASLLDEAIAAAEAMFLAFSHHNQEKKTFFADMNLFPQSLELLKTKATYLDINLIISDITKFDFSTLKNDLCGVIVQTPDNTGRLCDYKALLALLPTDAVKIIACDLLALTVSQTPREQGAHIAIGNTQRFGVPLGYGGPHAAFLATEDQFKRKLPGRIIGVSKDVHGNPAYRMALQTREQHIRREKATSNICTAQALLANMAAMYAVYHGPEGLTRIATRVNGLAQMFSAMAKHLGLELVNERFFDTVALRHPQAHNLQAHFYAREVNVRLIDHRTISLSFDETHTLQDVQNLGSMLSDFVGASSQPNLMDFTHMKLEHRSTPFMQQSIFNSLHSEHQITRYMQHLQQKDVSLVHSMITLGSCTMKLNPTSFMVPVTYPGFSKLHPYVPRDCAQGYHEMVQRMSSWLCNVTGFVGMSMQPNSGAQGEYAGLLCIRKYHMHHGHTHRNICLIPTSAHGTNPASAILAGLKVITIATKGGYIDLEDLKAKIDEHSNNLACIMITYPSTHGVYEAGVRDVIDMVHSNGGLVYMDGANMNAQCGLTSPGFLGADVCHLNLHKTFSIPHGGGGPGMGPIGVNERLLPFLPTNYDERAALSVGQLAGARFGSASILPISYSYIAQLGREGVRKCSIIAMLNANYMMKELEQDYGILYQGQNGMCAHEFILDIRTIKSQCGVSEEDIAKRLIDYGFHAPTMSFPVAGTLMIEPTESEDKAELDRFIDAMKSIRREIRKVEVGEFDKHDNPLKNAPHTQKEVCSDKWDHKYSRQEAAFPLKYIEERGKFWPSVGRIQNAYGDRNLVTVVPQQSPYFGS